MPDGRVVPARTAADIPGTLANIIAWWNRCVRTRAAGFLLTSWEPQGLAAELPMAVAAAAAGLWIENENDPRRLWELGCRRAFGKQGRASATRLWDSDRKPFCGYPRWQINDRWDAAVTDEPVESWRREAQFCAKLADSGKLPPAVSASLPVSRLLGRARPFRTTGRTRSVRPPKGRKPQRIASPGKIARRIAARGWGFLPDSSCRPLGGADDVAADEGCGRNRTE